MYRLLLHLTTLNDTLVKTPLDEGSARRKDIYLTTHNIYKKQTAMPRARFEPEIAENVQLQTTP
jgi:DNA-binding transcriptional regulator GbsR (MarR family)